MHFESPQKYAIHTCPAKKKKKNDIDPYYLCGHPMFRIL